MSNGSQNGGYDHETPKEREWRQAADGVASTGDSHRIDEFLEDLEEDEYAGDIRHEVAQEIRDRFRSF